jgi:hypothetical protein
MKTERRESLENINVTAEPMVPWRRPPSEREASDTSTDWKHRGSGDGMSAKDQEVNTGSPMQREARSQPEVREEQTGLKSGGGKVRSSDETSNDRGAKGP